MPAKTEETNNASPLDAASDRIRDMAKWLLAAFGAVGVVVIAGVALSDLRQVQSDELRVAALAGALIAVIGVATAILAAGSVVTKSFVTLTDVAQDKRYPITDEILLAGFSSAENFRETYADALRKHRKTAKQLYEHLEQAPATAPTPAPNTPEAGRDPTSMLTQKAQAAAKLVAFYDQMCSPLLARQSFLQVQRAYKKAQIGMACGALLSVSGILLFVFATAKPAGAPVVGKTPTQVLVSIQDSQQTRVATLLGPRCDLKHLTATAIATEGNSTVLAVARSADCNEGLVRLSPQDAVISKKP